MANHPTTPARTTRSDALLGAFAAFFLVFPAGMMLLGLSSGRTLQPRLLPLGVLLLIVAPIAAAVAAYVAQRRQPR